MTLDDQKRLVSLWMQFLDGNEIAFSQLYCLFFDDLLTYGRRVGGDNEMVEDLIQDLFLKLYQVKNYSLKTIQDCALFCFVH